MDKRCKFYFFRMSLKYHHHIVNGNGLYVWQSDGKVKLRGQSNGREFDLDLEFKSLVERLKLAPEQEALFDFEQPPTSITNPSSISMEVSWHMTGLPEFTERLWMSYSEEHCRVDMLERQMREMKTQHTEKIDNLIRELNRIHEQQMKDQNSKRLEIELRLSSRIYELERKVKELEAKAGAASLNSTRAMYSEVS